MDSHDAKAAGSGTSCSRKRGPYGKWKSMDSSEIALVPDDSAEADVPMRRMHDTKKNKVILIFNLKKEVSVYCFPCLID